MRKLAWIFIVTAFLSKCMAAAETTNNLPVKTIAKGAMSGITTATQLVITNQNKWEEVWKQHNVRVRSEQKETPKIDFSKEMVLVTTLGQKMTGGFAIEITRAETSGGKLRVFVRKKTPPAGAMTLEALTAPFHFAVIPKSDLPVEWNP